MYIRSFMTALLLLSGIATFAQQERWVGTWTCAPQTVDKRFMPYNNQLDDRAVRQIVKVSIGGNTIRLKLSNELSDEPVEMESVYVARAENEYDIDKETVRYLKFNGRDCNHWSE